MGLIDKILSALGLKEKREEIKLEPDTMNEYREAKSWKQKESVKKPVYKHRKRK